MKRSIAPAQVRLYREIAGNKERNSQNEKICCKDVDFSNKVKISNLIFLSTKQGTIVYNRFRGSLLDDFRKERQDMAATNKTVFDTVVEQFIRERLDDIMMQDTEYIGLQDELWKENY